MRIMFFIPRMGSGGAERVISILANEFANNGDSVQITQLIESESFYPLSEEIILKGMNIKIRRNNKLVSYLDQGRFFFKGISFIKREVKQFHPDVVISFMRQTCIMMWAARLLCCRVKLVCSERNDPTVQNAFVRRLMKKVFKSSDLLVCQGKGVYDYFDKVSDKVIIPNPVVDRKELYVDFDKRRNVVTSVGRLDRQKNFEMLIRSFADVHIEYPDYILEIYGEGPERSNLERLITDLNASAYVLLQGASKDVISRISDSSLFVMSSNYEGFPNALAEAMSVGLPVISTDFFTGAAREMIGDDCGMLVPVGDQTSMTEAIKECLLDHNKRERMSLNAIKISERYSKDKVVNMWRRAIEKVMAKGDYCNE